MPLLQFGNGLRELPERPRQPIELPNYQSVALGNFAKRGSQLRPVSLGAC